MPLQKKKIVIQEFAENESGSELYTYTHFNKSGDPKIQHSSSNANEWRLNIIEPEIDNPDGAPHCYPVSMYLDMNFGCVKYKNNFYYFDPNYFDPNIKGQDGMRLINTDQTTFQKLEGMFKDLEQTRAIDKNKVIKGIKGTDKYKARKATDEEREIIRSAAKLNDYNKGVELTNLEIINNNLKSSIEDANTPIQERAKRLKELLTNNFIYEIGSSKKDSVSSEKGPISRIYKLCLTRPNVEALFYDNNEMFQKLVQSLIEKDEPELYKAFATSLVGTDLDNNSLFLWNEAMRDGVTQQFKAIHDHGVQLSGRNDKDAKEKGAIVQALGDNLLNQLKTRPTNMPKPNDYKTQFENLQFKLNTLNILSKQDQNKEFTKHRGLWGAGVKRFLVNACTIFCIAIPNFINLALTGNFLFFNKATSEAKRTEAQKGLGFDPKKGTIKNVPGNHGPVDDESIKSVPEKKM